MRGAFPAILEQAMERLWAQAAASIPEWLPMRYIEWLPTAYEVALRFTRQRPEARTCTWCCWTMRTASADPTGSMSA
jgi:hypothetical protein